MKSGVVYRLKQNRFGLDAGTNVMLTERSDWGLAATDTQKTGTTHYSVEPVGGGKIITVTKHIVEIVH
jgi:hypothetical protein